MNINKQGVCAFIVNSKNEVLMLDHVKHDKLALPGGKVDPGEDAVFAIARELYEEVGIQNFTLGDHHVVLDDVTGVLFHIFVVMTKDTPFNKEPKKHRAMLWVDSRPENFKGNINRITFTALKKIGYDVGTDEYID
ncbi:MutT/NUDIX hydrolase [Shewanella phage FishSpeaker]|nr:MutT/NUDIX hydrolase [Shewanella phage FishSpeaker]